MLILRTVRHNIRRLALTSKNCSYHFHLTAANPPCGKPLANGGWKNGTLPTVSIPRIRVVRHPNRSNQC